MTIEDFEGYENVDILIKKYGIKESLVQSPFEARSKGVSADAVKAVKFLAIGSGVFALPFVALFIYVFFFSTMM